MRRHLFRPRLATREGRSVSTDGERVQSSAFRSLVLPHLDGAYNLACFLTRDPALAEDVVQDAFLRAYKAFPQYRGASARAWLFAIVRNCCWAALKMERGIGRVTVRESSLSPEQARRLVDVPDDRPTPDIELDRAREAATLRRMIEDLPEPFREALVLREMEELSYKDIAVITGVAMGTVMSRLARARKMLGELLLPHDDGTDQAEREVGL